MSTVILFSKVLFYLAKNLWPLEKSVESLGKICYFFLLGHRYIGIGQLFVYLSKCASWLLHGFWRENEEKSLQVIVFPAQVKEHLFNRAS